MAEISRENAKKIMNSGYGCLIGKYDCVGKPCSMCEHNVSDEEVKNAMEKAISDMQKLDKIEKIITDIDCSNCGCNGIEEECNECHNEWIADIKQIVKG